MVSFRIRKDMRSIMLAMVVIAKFSTSVYSQGCGIPADLCSSQYGYCGAVNDYCAKGCQAGPSDVRVADFVTDAFFNRIADQAASNCAGNGFYTRAAFLEALTSYPQFGKVGSVDVSKREIAAFFAHTTYETGQFCNIETIDPSNNCCDESNKEYPCVAGKSYCGRGPIQLAWNFNYGPAGKSIGFDGLKNPEIVAKDSVVSFKTALWFWMNYCHDIITSGQGFGPTILAINGSPGCGGKDPDTVMAKKEYYTNYCKQLGVAPGDNLEC